MPYGGLAALCAVVRDVLPCAGRWRGMIVWSAAGVGGWECLLGRLREGQRFSKPLALRIFSIQECDEIHHQKQRHFRPGAVVSPTPHHCLLLASSCGVWRWTRVVVRTARF